MEQFIFIASWVGSLSGPMGAVLLAANIRASKYGYILFTLSSVLMCVAAYTKGDNPVLVQNVLFSLINGFGLYRWVLLPSRLATAQSREAAQLITRQV